jgi:hypothetical protein
VSRGSLRRRLARRRSAGLAILAAVTAIGVVAGCGSNSRPTKAAYNTRANRVCESLNQKMHAIAERPFGNLSAELKEVLKVKEQANTQLRAIRMPAADAVPSEWLRYRELAIGALKNIVRAKPRSPGARIANRAYVKANAKAEEIARAYGVTACVGFAA